MYRDASVVDQFAQLFEFGDTSSTRFDSIGMIRGAAHRGVEQEIIARYGSDVAVTSNEQMVGQAPFSTHYLMDVYQKFWHKRKRQAEMIISRDDSQLVASIISDVLSVFLSDANVHPDRISALMAIPNRSISDNSNPLELLRSLLKGMRDAPPEDGMGTIVKAWLKKMGLATKREAALIVGSAQL